MRQFTDNAMGAIVKKNVAGERRGTFGCSDKLRFEPRGMGQVGDLHHLSADIPSCIRWVDGLTIKTRHKHLVHVAQTEWLVGNANGGDGPRHAQGKLLGLGHERGAVIVRERVVVLIISVKAAVFAEKRSRLHVQKVKRRAACYWWLHQERWLSYPRMLSM